MDWTVIFLVLAVCGVLYGIKHKGGFSNLPDALTSIVGDTLNGKFRFRKWHKHSVAGLALGSAFFVACVVSGLPKIPAGFVSVGLVYAGAELVEFWQRHKGANKTASEQFESVKDVLVTVIAGVVGVLLTIPFL